MSKETTRGWYTESAATNSYAALPLRGGTADYHQFLREAGEIFATATRAFEMHPRGAAAVTTDGLNLTIGGGWLGFAGRIVKAYRQAHFDHIHTDEDYRDRLGELMDSYPRLGTHAKRGETARQRARRYTHEGHELVHTAVLEGVYTTAATYAVAPGVVQQALSGEDPHEQAELCNALLPSMNLMNRQLARHSKHGNETFIQAAALPASFINRKKVNYKALRYDPAKFAVQPDEHGQPALHFLPDAHHDGDTTNYFSGCPALAGGSITRLNLLMSGLIREEDCYERAFGNPGAYAVAAALQTGGGNIYE